MSFAEFERSLITSRLAGSRKIKARGSQHAGGRAPIGYSADKALVLDPAKALALKSASELREKWLMFQAIADTLDDEEYTTKAGGPFRKMQIERIMDRDELCRGQYRYSGIESQGRYEAIL